MFASLRKFGTEYSDLPRMLSNVSFFLRPLILNIDSRRSKSIPIVFYILTLVLAACYFYVYLISVGWFVFWRCAETGDPFARIVILSLGLSSEIGTVKFICMLLNIKNIRKLLDNYMVCDSLLVPGSRFSKNVLKTLKFVKKRAIIFWIVIIGNGVFYIIKPLFLPGRHLMDDVFILYGLEPMNETPNFQIAYSVTTAGVCFTCYLPANITALLIVLSGYIEAQMLALSEEVRNLYKDAEKHLQYRRNENVVNDDTEELYVIEKREVHKYIKERLKGLIKTHAMIINLANQLERVFRNAIAIEFVLLVIGLIVELLGGLEKTYVEVPFALMQVGMDCYVGQRVMDASIVFEQAVYGCNWQEFDSSNHVRMVILMLQNSQKTLKLTAGGVTMLSFSCLMSVIRSIYSAYTTLRTMMNKNNL